MGVAALVQRRAKIRVRLYVEQVQIFRVTARWTTDVRMDGQRIYTQIDDRHVVFFFPNYYYLLFAAKKTPNPPPTLLQPLPFSSELPPLRGTLMSMNEVHKFRDSEGLLFHPFPMPKPKVYNDVETKCSIHYLIRGTDMRYGTSVWLYSFF
jgi:hypothetical protein